MEDPATPDAETMAELTRAGEAVDRAIATMLQQGLGPVPIASALLGGAMCLMSKTLGDEAVMRMLHNAEAGVRSGHLRQ